MATVTTPVVATIELQRRQQAVTAAYGSAGDAVSSPAGTSMVKVINVQSSRWPVQYRVNSDAWADLSERQSVELSIDLSTDTLRLRRGQNAPAAGAVDLEFYAKPSALSAAGSPIVADDRKARALQLLARADASNLHINPIPAAPVTVDITATDPTLPVSYAMAGLVGSSSGLWRTYGGVEKNDGGNYSVVSASGGANGAGNGSPKQSVMNAPYIEFITASSRAALKFFGNGAAQRMRVAVNGVYQSGPITAPGTGVHFLTIGVGAVPLPAGANRIRIEFEQSSGNMRALLQNLFVAANHTIYAPTVEQSINALFAGDSWFSTGAPGQFEHDGLPAVVGKRMGWDYWASAIGGTGYKNAGANSVYGSPGRLADYAVRPFDYVVVLGSLNDSTGAAGTQAYTDTVAAALAFWRNLRLVQPAARIIIFGVPVTLNQALTAALNGEAALMEAFAEWGDQNAAFIPISSYGVNGSLAWITDASAANFINATDRTHLEPGSGVFYFGDRMVQQLRQNL